MLSLGIQSPVSPLALIDPARSGDPDSSDAKSDKLQQQTLESSIHT
jgi:hypothetical protein